MIFTLVDGMRESPLSLAHSYISLVVDTSREIYFSRSAARASLPGRITARGSGLILRISGREGETATFLSRCLFNSNGFGGGFAPRHLSRWALLFYYSMRKITAVLILLILPVFMAAQDSRVASVSEKPSQFKNVRVNGVQLHYLEKGKGVPVIFVHGGLDDYRMWEAQIKPFSENYHVIAYGRRYNYPNNNLNVRPDHSALVEAEDLAALIKKLKLKPAHIIGHSYGALTALFLAVKHPKMVRTLVLSEAPAHSLALDKPAGAVLVNEFLDNLWKPAALAFNNNEKERALRLTVKYFAGADVYEQVPQNVRDYWMGNIREWEALTTSRDAFPALSREKVKRIKIPVLMLSGERSLKVLKFIDEELKPLLPNAERIIVQNATHDMWSEQPDTLKKAVFGFLEKH